MHLHCVISLKLRRRAHCCIRRDEPRKRESALRSYRICPCWALLAVEGTWESQITENPGDRRTQRHRLVNPLRLVLNCVWSVPDRWAVLTLRAQALLYTAMLTSVVLTLKKESLRLLESAIYSQSGSKITQLNFPILQAHWFTWKRQRTSTNSVRCSLKGLAFP